MNNFVILIPNYNDWDNLNVLIPKIHNILKNKDKSFSIIIINDASTIKNNLAFKSELCFKKIEILNLIKNIKAQKAITTALYYLKKKNYNGGIIYSGFSEPILYKYIYEVISLTRNLDDYVEAVLQDKIKRLKRGSFDNWNWLGVGDEEVFKNYPDYQKQWIKAFIVFFHFFHTFF